MLFKSLHIPGIILAKFKHFALIVCDYSSRSMVLLKGIALFLLIHCFIHSDFQFSACLPLTSGALY